MLQSAVRWDPGLRACLWLCQAEVQEAMVGQRNIQTTASLVLKYNIPWPGPKSTLFAAFLRLFFFLQ